MTVRFRMEGLSELDAALAELTKATGRNTLRRVLVEAAQPMADSMRATAPDDPSTGGNDLRSSITVSTKLSPRQARLHRKIPKDERYFAEAFVGPGPDPAGVQQEFGNIIHPAQPFVRPAWDQHKISLLDRIAIMTRQEIEKAVARRARRLARRG